MTFIVFQFVLSALVIVVAGSFLTKFADQISEATGWGRIFVGGLLLVGATSLPELMVDLQAVRLDLIASFLNVNVKFITLITF